MIVEQLVIEFSDCLVKTMNSPSLWLMIGLVVIIPTVLSLISEEHRKQYDRIMDTWIDFADNHPTIGPLGIFKVFSDLSAFSIFNTINYSGLAIKSGIDNASKLIEFSTPSFGFMPMMTMASAHESHAPIIRTYKQFGSSKEGDSDGDGDDADNSDKVERDESHHGDKSSWERVLDKFAELSARLDQLEKMEGSCCPVDSGSR